MKNKSLYIISLIVIVAAGAGAYLLMHNSKDTNTGSDYSSGKTAYKAPIKPDTKGVGTVIQTLTDAKLGKYLADSTGNPLYTYGADTAGKSNCSGSCLSAWPAYVVTSSQTALPTDVSVINRSDGTQQYAYKDMPLYTFTSDSVGKVTGDDVSDFHVAKP